MRDISSLCDVVCGLNYSYDADERCLDIPFKLHTDGDQVGISFGGIPIWDEQERECDWGEEPGRDFTDILRMRAIRLMTGTLAKLSKIGGNG